MPDSVQEPPSNQPPPCGDISKAERYLNWLLDLIAQDKLLVTHTDLQKFDNSALQDHYQISLPEYIVELSFTKHAESDRHSYVMIFNNIQMINEGVASKAILAYIPLTEQQFQEFKYTADDQIARKKKEFEDKRFKDAMAPLDQVLEQLTQSPKVTAEQSENHTTTPTNGMAADQPSDPDKLIDPEPDLETTPLNSSTSHTNGSYPQF